MTDTFLEVLKQAPPLAVLVLVVYIFLRHLKDRDEQFAETVREINIENHTARTESRRVIENNSLVIEKSIETRGELMQVIRELREKL